VRGDFIGGAVPVVELSFQETRSGGSWAWHQDPAPRFVITLSGTLEFQTKSGATFTIHPSACRSSNLIRTIPACSNSAPN
jgi:hypothetical protein